MRKVLSELEAALKKKYPRKLATFAKSTKNLAKLGDVPEEVVSLYAWHGAAPGLLTTKDTEEGYDGWDLSPPTQVAADAKIWTKLHGVRWLPLFSNGAGDNVALDDKKRLVGLFHEDPEDRPVLFPSLEAAMKYVLSRVKAGTWCGVPETNELKRVLEKIEKGKVDSQDLFGNDIFRLMRRDPRAGLQAIAAAQKAGAPPETVTKYRAEAQLAAGQLDRAWESFRAYLREVMRIGSTYNPPWLTMRDGFARAKQKDRAFAANELHEMSKAYLFGAWLERGDKSSMREIIANADAAMVDTDPEAEVQGWMRHGMSEKEARAKVKILVASGALSAVKGADLARARSAKAQALGVLGKKAEAKKVWAQAAKADAKVAAFWKSFEEMIA